MAKLEVLPLLPLVPIAPPEGGVALAGNLHDGRAEATADHVADPQLLEES
jgi:hypothetical protein